MSGSRADDIEYVVKTNLAPEYVTQVGLEIFKQWMEFAQGRGEADGQRIAHATGGYANSISFAQTGVATVAIVADPGVDIAAHYLEVGHERFDLKQTEAFLQGRIFHSAMWAYPSKRFPAGDGPAYVQVGATGWILPVMRAYAPAKVFAHLAARMAGVL